MSIGKQIKAMRKIRGLTQKELAEKCSMADSAVRKYESGKIVPKIEMLKRIADALEMPVGAFLPSMGLGESTGSRIKIARERQGVTQAELAEKMGVTPQTISQYERNIINPKPETIKKFADALGVDARWLEVGEYEDNSLSGEEQQLLRYFRIMSPEGQRVALERMDELSQHPRYKKRLLTSRHRKDNQHEV